MSRGRRSAVSAAPGQVRIIGGRWRGRKLPVLASPGLRPSPDRLRETLFNWLMPRLAGARVLDLFAGSGALGIEAASRGAAEVTLVELNPAVAAQLHANLNTLDAHPQVSVVQADWRQALQSAAGPWDIVFVDPPFAERLQRPALEALAAGKLSPDARVHVECAHDERSELPAGYERLKEKRFGDVHASLLTLSAACVASAG